jgi:hypothetical protein
MYRVSLLFVLFCFVLACAKKKQSVNNLHQQKISSTALRSILFVSDSICIVAGGNSFLQDKIFRSTNGTASFDSIPFVPTEPKEITSMVLHNNVIHAAGFGSYHCYSKDSGATWIWNGVPSWSGINAMASYGDTLLMVSGDGEKGSVIFHKNNYEYLAEHFFNKSIRGIAIANDSTLFLCGHAVILKSTNRGATWDYTSANGDFFSSIVCVDGKNILATGLNGTVLYSPDLGTTWQNIKKQNTFSTGYVWNAIVVKNNSEALLLGNNGKIALFSFINSSLQEIESFTDTDLAHAAFRNNQWFVVDKAGNLFRFNL